jgi:hypothetical protein
VVEELGVLVAAGYTFMKVTHGLRPSDFDHSAPRFGTQTFGASMLWRPLFNAGALPNCATRRLGRQSRDSNPATSSSDKRLPPARTGERTGHVMESGVPEGVHAR